MVVMGKTAESKSLVELWYLFVNQLQLIRYLGRRSHYFDVNCDLNV